VLELFDQVELDRPVGRRYYRLDKPRDTAGPTGSAVAVGYGKVWVLTCGTCNTGGHNGELLEFDPARGKVVRRFPVGRQGPNAVAIGAGYVWLANQVDESVTQRDPKTGRIVRRIRVGDPGSAAICGIAAGRDALWVAVGNRNCESST